jgi:hypothetical protein
VKQNGRVAFFPCIFPVTQSVEHKVPTWISLHDQYIATCSLLQDAREAIKKSVSLWLPQLQAADRGDIAEEQFDPVEVCTLNSISELSRF